jgi:hypothetical protein
MSKNKQSSVEHFWQQLEEKGNAHIETEGVITVNITIDVNEYRLLKKETKAMHKEEMEHFFKMGMSLVEGRLWKPIDKFEEAYNETFGSQTTLAQEEQQ